MNPSNDDQPHRCAWVSITRCRNPGSFSHSTFGEGPWYCSGHALCHDPIEGSRIVEASESRYPNGAPRAEDILAAARSSVADPANRLSVEQARAAFRRVGKGLPDPHAWAKSIVDRIAAGEVLPPISLEMAREVIPIPTREPGSDDV